MPQTRSTFLCAASLCVVVSGSVAVLTLSHGRPAIVDAAGFAAPAAPARSVLTAAQASAVPESSGPPKAVVAVSAAEVWAGHRKVRSYDRPALRRPANLRAWLLGMTFYQRSHLYRRLATQVRYGEPVVVLGHRGELSRIRIPDQTGGMFPRGIIGWIASRQLAPEPAGWESATKVATVTAKRAVLDATRGGTTHALEVSYATTLPVLDVQPHRVVVAVPGAARQGWLPRDAVRVHEPGAPALRVSAHLVVAQARRFLGLPYLWAGMTSWGYDCSGLTSTVYSMLGLTLPRDAADQSLVGKAVARRNLRPGDLVFFSSTRQRGGIHHVAIYAGHGRVLQSPYTGARIELTRLRGSSLNREYWGATRPLS